jgi:hypothetical protein
VSPVTLREYLEQRLREADLRHQQRYDAQREAISEALRSAERAVAKAEAASEKRFESVNEFRQTLADQSAGLLTRLEADARFRAHDEKIDALAARLDKSEGTSGGQKTMWGYVVGAVGVAAAVASALVLLNK